MKRSRDQSAEAPNNVGLWPESIGVDGRADEAFYEKVNVACYPPEADFLVHSRKTPEAVTDYAEYVRRREVYDQTQSKFSAYRRWPSGLPSTQPARTGH